MARQLTVMEARFAKSDHISKEERECLGEEIGVPEKAIMTWFQNRRARLRRASDLQKMLKLAAATGTF